KPLPVFPHSQQRLLNAVLGQVGVAYHPVDQVKSRLFNQTCEPAERLVDLIPRADLAKKLSAKSCLVFGELDAHDGLRIPVRPPLSVVSRPYVPARDRSAYMRGDGFC